VRLFFAKSAGNGQQTDKQRENDVRIFGFWPFQTDTGENRRLFRPSLGLMAGVFIAFLAEFIGLVRNQLAGE
jgi:hypothetical protein